MTENQSSSLFWKSCVRALNRIMRVVKSHHWNQMAFQLSRIIQTTYRITGSDNKQRNQRSHLKWPKFISNIDTRGQTNNRTYESKLESMNLLVCTSFRKLMIGFRWSHSPHMHFVTSSSSLCIQYPTRPHRRIPRHQHRTIYINASLCTKVWSNLHRRRPRSRNLRLAIRQRGKPKTNARRLQ